MAERRQTEWEQQERLLQTLAEDTALSCEQSEELLPALVQAEAAGEDVDSDPAYAALLHHLDTCPDSAAKYAALVADLATITAPAPATSASPAMAPPRFFQPAPVRQTERFTLRVWNGIARAVELLVSPPALVPKLATLSRSKSETLFSDRVTELPGDPLVVVMLTAQEQDGLIQVAVRDATAGTRWQVQLTIGAERLEQTTNTQGVAQFPGIALAGLSQMTVTCAELV